ncbi:MAG: hypothetical protein ACXAB4_14210 [Candidatus Hodarchaeales archaeon]
MSANNSLASTQQESERKGLQEELERLSKSLAEFEDQRKRTLATLKPALFSLKSRIPQLLPLVSIPFKKTLKTKALS